jgi:hypothetical protein
MSNKLDLDTINWDALDGEAAKGILFRIWPLLAKKVDEEGFTSLTQIESVLFTDIEYYDGERVRRRIISKGWDENYV